MQQAEKLQFKVLLEQRLPVIRGVQRNQIFLRSGKYAMIPSDWRRMWAAFIGEQGGPRPPPPNVSSLCCKHGRLAYDPTEWFQKHRGGLPKLTHPDLNAYVLVPIEEAEAIRRSYGLEGIKAVLESSEGDVAVPAAWCELTCTEAPNEDPNINSLRTYFCFPAPCAECVAARRQEASRRRIFDVKLFDAMGPEGLLGKADHFQVAATEASTGSDLKELIVAAGIRPELRAAQILLSLEMPNLEPTQIGDSESVEALILARQPVALADTEAQEGVSLTPVTLSAAVHASDVAEPAAKRRRPGSSLLTSHLARGAQES